MEQCEAVATMTCRRCGETKPVEEFDRRNDRPSGYHSLCKECRRAYQRERWQCSSPPRPPRAKRVVGTAALLVCTVCLRSLTWNAFPPRRRGGTELQSWCRECFRARNRAYYARHRDAEVTRSARNLARRRDELRKHVRAYLIEHPCVDCGETDLVVLEFDHVAGVKLCDVAEMIARADPWSRVLSEIAKCMVRCANCHRRRTAQQFGYRRVDASVDRELAAIQLLLPDGVVRRCRRCGEHRPIDEFPFRSARRGTRHRICKRCARAYAREWYQRHRTRHLAAVRVGRRTARRRAKRFVREFLAHHPCVDCACDDLTVLEFDHIGPKLREVSWMMQHGLSRTTIMRELAKCEVRCANCHRRKTRERALAAAATPR